MGVHIMWMFVGSWIITITAGLFAFVIVADRTGTWRQMLIALALDLLALGINWGVVLRPIWAKGEHLAVSEMFLFLQVLMVPIFIGLTYYLWYTKSPASISPPSP